MAHSDYNSVTDNVITNVNVIKTEYIELVLGIGICRTLLLFGTFILLHC